jgi:hypothetical protein
VNYLTSRLKAHVGYQFDLVAAATEVAQNGFFRHLVRRLLRAG